MTPRRIIYAVLIVAGLTGCTNHQLGLFIAWHETDPVAAEQFADQPHIQTELVEQVAAASSTSSWSVNWDAVAECESGGRWDYPPVTNRHGTFTGGLMFWTKTWDAYGGEEFASDAYLTSKANQIIVAERVVDDVGFDQAWQCDDR